jgi:hypothetical protein
MRVRLPLQTGASAFSMLAFWPAVITLVTSGAVIVDAWLRRSGAPDAWQIPARVVIILSLVTTISPLAVLGEIVFVYVRLRRAIEARACDAILDSDGLHLEGGQSHGLRVPYSEIDCARSAVEGQTLYLARHGGERIRLAVASDPDELQSLQALLATLRAMSAPAPAPSVSPSAHVLDCPGCGVPVAPADALTVTCRQCGVEVAMSDALRAQLQAARAISASRLAADRAVERLLRQPSARRANLVVLANAAAILVLWPVNGIFPLIAYFDPDRASFAWMACFTLGAVLLLLAVARVVLADRHALRLLTLGFAAHAPATVSEPSRCRVCLGPLPARDDGGLVVRCAFCSSANLLGLDVRAEAAVARSSEREALAALVRQRSARQRRLVAVAAALGLSAVGGIGLNSATRLEAERAAREPTCAEVPTDDEHELGDPEPVATSPFANPAYVVVDNAGAQEFVAQSLMHDTVEVASGANIEAPAVSPDGRSVVFGHRYARSGNFGLEMLTAEGQHALQTVVGSPRFAAFSPDGGWLSFSARSGGARQLYVARVSQPSRNRAIVCGRRHVVYSAWSPDGQDLAFMATAEVADEILGAGDLWTVHIDGHQARQRTSGNRVSPERILWKSDGFIYFHTAGGVRRVSGR